MRSHKPRAWGFTLLEMSIVIVLVAAIVGIVAVVFSSLLKTYQYKETHAKMKVIQQALYEYRVAFNSIPCPADVTLPLGHTHFGVMAQNLGICTGGIPTANFSSVDGTPQEPREGMVPTQTLHLPDDYAFDGWGRRMMYIVNKDVTQLGGFNIVTGYDPTQRMTINNEQGNPNTQLAVYVLVSYGPNGHGGYPRKGGTTRINAGSTNLDELNNCDCDNSATATGLDGIFVQKDPSLNPTNNLDAYDDVVEYGTRVDMVLKSSLAWSLGPQYTYSASGVGSRSRSTSGSCFPAGTRIATPNGDTPIETLLPGDEVLAVDANGKSKAVKVKVFMAKRSALLTLQTDNGSLHTTEDHPLMLPDNSFRPAGELKEGDHVMVWKDEKLVASKIGSITHQQGEQTVFNLEVEEPHTFIADGFVVHNKIWVIY